MREVCPSLTPIYSFYGALTNSKDGSPVLVIFIITLKRVNLTAQQTYLGANERNPDKCIAISRKTHQNKIRDVYYTTLIDA